MPADAMCESLYFYLLTQLHCSLKTVLASCLLITVTVIKSRLDFVHTAVDTCDCPC